MKLFVVRHASYSPSHIDPNEGLSIEGIKEAKALRSFFDKMEISFDALLSSTKRRAIETASILSDKEPCHYAPSLSAESLLTLALEKGPSVLLIGHNPILQDLTNLLGYDLHFHPASCAHFLDEKLEWFISAKILSAFSSS